MPSEGAAPFSPVTLNPSMAVMLVYFSPQELLLWLLKRTSVMLFFSNASALRSMIMRMGAWLLP